MESAQQQHKYHIIMMEGQTHIIEIEKIEDKCEDLKYKLSKILTKPDKLLTLYKPGKSEPLDDKVLLTQIKDDGNSTVLSCLVSPACHRCKGMGKYQFAYPPDYCKCEDCIATGILTKCPEVNIITPDNQTKNIQLPAGYCEGWDVLATDIQFLVKNLQPIFNHGTPIFTIQSNKNYSVTDIHGKDYSLKTKLVDEMTYYISEC